MKKFWIRGFLAAVAVFALSLPPALGEEAGKAFEFDPFAGLNLTQEQRTSMERLLGLGDHQVDGFYEGAVSVRGRGGPKIKFKVDKGQISTISSDQPGLVLMGSFDRFGEAAEVSIFGLKGVGDNWARLWGDTARLQGRVALTGDGAREGPITIEIRRGFAN